MNLEKGKNMIKIYQNIFKFKILVCVCLYVCNRNERHAHMSLAPLEAGRGQDIQVVMNHLTWHLATKLRSFRRTMKAPSC